MKYTYYMESETETKIQIKVQKFSNILWNTSACAQTFIMTWFENKSPH